jgi:hypothetical protein
MKCNVCKKSAKGLVKCVECGSMFCADCGEQKRERCSICMQFETDFDNDDSSSDE